MLEVKIDAKQDYWDDASQQFLTIEAQTIRLEHSLISISKWEQKWHEPFLEMNPDKPRSLLKTYDYIRCMLLDPNVDPRVVYAVSDENMQLITKYINDPATATTINDRNMTRRSREIVTSELIYYWMIDLGIPFECEKWHLNRLMTLIRVCGIKNGPQKNMSRRDIMKQNAALNAARRAKHGTRG